MVQYTRSMYGVEGGGDFAREQAQVLNTFKDLFLFVGNTISSCTRTRSDGKTPFVAYRIRHVIALRYVGKSFRHELDVGAVLPFSAKALVQEAGKKTVCGVSYHNEPVASRDNARGLESGKLPSLLRVTKAFHRVHKNCTRG